MEGEELSRRRGRIGLRGAEPGVHEAAVIGHDVQHVAHAAVGQAAAQIDQGGVPAQVRVDVVVVGHVVAVVAVSRENRVQVEGVDAEATLCA